VIVLVVGLAGRLEPRLQLVMGLGLGLEGDVAMVQARRQLGRPSQPCGLRLQHYE
jgi:hypothetical protein